MSDTERKRQAIERMTQKIKENGSPDSVEKIRARLVEQQQKRDRETSK